MFCMQYSEHVVTMQYHAHNTIVLNFLNFFNFFNFLNFFNFPINRYVNYALKFSKSSALKALM